MTDLKTKYHAILDKVPDIGLGLGLCGAHRTGKTTLAIAHGVDLTQDSVWCKG